MKDSLYIFSVLLGVMSVISAFGGALRFRENFIDEVFDLIDDKKQIGSRLGYDASDIGNNASSFDKEELMPSPLYAESPQEITGVVPNDNSLITEANVGAIEEEIQEEFQQGEYNSQDQIEAYSTVDFASV
jgi:hypothetical protein